MNKKSQNSKEIKILKPSELKKGHSFKDGSILKKKYFFDDKLHVIIYLDENDEVKYKFGPDFEDSLNSLENLAMVQGEILLLANFLKEDLNLKLAHIYKLAINNEKLNAQKEVDSLYIDILNRKKILKQFIYLATPMIVSSTLYFSLWGLLYFNLTSSNLITTYKEIFIFAGIGNFLSTAKNIKTIEFNTSEEIISYTIFAIFKYLTSLFSAVLLIVLYNSNIINLKIDGASREYIVRLLATLGGFSQNIVPNIFEKLEKKI